MLLLKSFFRLKIHVWLGLLLALVIGGAYVYGVQVSLIKTDRVSQSYATVKYLEEVNEIVFLNVGVEKVVTQTNNTKIPWTEIGIPATEKRALIILNYAVKLGIKQPVTIQKTGENAVTVHVPKFEIIGFDLDKEHPYVLYDSSGELLSGLTKDIDTGNLFAKALSQAEKEAYVDKYQQDIKRAAASYYQTTIKAIDKDLNVSVMFKEK